MFNWTQSGPEGDASWRRLRQVEGREWWLWAFAIAVTLVLTVGILSLTFPRIQPWGDVFYAVNLKEWIRALVALVLLFDIYTIYQHLQLQSVRRRLAEREQLFHLITKHAADMIAVVDMKGQRIYNSPAYERILGYTAEELAATSSFEQVHPDDRVRVLEAAEKARLTGRGERLEYRIHHKDGSWRVLESTSSPIPGPNGEPEGLVIVNRDITERKRAEALLEHRAFHDSLTNLPNRALFLDRLQRSLSVSRRHLDFKFAVLLIDIDQFKVFNDSLGYSAGDELLIQIAWRLQACLRSADTISRSPDKKDNSGSESTLARPGGDEFVVLAEELHDPSDAVRMAERILQRLAVPFTVNGHEIVISASIGIALSGNEGTEPEDVLRDAEIAMYRAKHGGKARCEVFDTAMQVDALRRLQLETDLRNALELDEFLVHYQPIVSLQTGKIIGCEALTRWKRVQGIVMPGEFISVADEIGVVLPMNRKLLRDGCQQLRRWQEMYSSKSPLTLSVNVTAKQFAQTDLASQIGEIVIETGVDPATVNLEMTENIAMGDAKRSAVVLAELKSLGVHLSIDDFGTGYSSLCRLQQFPVDTLKIDRAFISAMNLDSDTYDIVQAILSLAQNLGLKVVAEGIEDQKQMETLKRMGCEAGQGFLFSEAVPAEIFEQLLAGELILDR